MRKKVALEVITLLILIIVLALGIGIKVYQDRGQVLKAKTIENEKLKKDNKKLVKDNEDLVVEVAELTATSKGQNNKIAFQEGEISRFETRLQELAAQAEKDTKPKLIRFYNGKLTEMVFQENEINAINHPVDIYEEVTQRNIAFFISGIPVKSVYVNQQKLEDVTYNEQEKMYAVNYYMPGEGQYTFIVETDNGNYYFSVNY